MPKFRALIEFALPSIEPTILPLRPAGGALGVFPVNGGGGMYTLLYQNIRISKLTIAYPCTCAAEHPGELVDLVEERITLRSWSCKCGLKSLAIILCLPRKP